MYYSQVAAKRLTFRAKLLLALRGGNRMTMSAFGTKRTSLVAPHMSAFGAKRTCAVLRCKFMTRSGHHSCSIDYPCCS